MSTVTRPERSRLLEAMLEELVEKGYQGVEVEDAVRRAHLSGAEWQVLFPDKDSCLIAAFDQLAAQLRAAVCAGCAAGRGWPERVANGLRALLAELAGREAMAEALARTLPSIGPAAQARYQAFVEGLAPLLAEGREASGVGTELPDEVELLAVGAAEAIVFDEIGAGRTAGLAALGPELLFSLLVPFLGPAAAASEMERMRAGEGLGRLEPA
jgi:AcrR family transcriptional regulator